MYIQYVFIICDLVLFCLTCARVLFQFDFDTFSEQVGDFKWLEARKAASADQAEVLSAARKLGKNQVTSSLIIPPPQNVGGGAILDSLCRVGLSVRPSVSNSCPLYNSFTNGRISFKLE